MDDFRPSPARILKSGPEDSWVGLRSQDVRQRDALRPGPWSRVFQGRDEGFDLIFWVLSKDCLPVRSDFGSSLIKYQLVSKNRAAGFVALLPHAAHICNQRVGCVARPFALC